MLFALAFGLAIAAVDVTGDVTCPAPAEVSRALANLAPANAGATKPSFVHLSRSARGLHLELSNATGERLAERDLTGGDSCADLAQAAAVIVGAWEADLDPRLTARVDLPAPVAPTKQPDTTIRMTPSPPAPPLRFDLGLALIASLTGGQLAPGAGVHGWLAPGGWHTGFGVTVSGVTARSEAVGTHADAVRWSRVAFGAGPEVRFDFGHTIVAAQAQAVAALLNIEGVGLTTTASSSNTQFGTGLGVRAGRAWGNATPWLGADVLAWPGHDRLAITGVAAQGQLPRLEFQLAFGLSLGRFP